MVAVVVMVPGEAGKDHRSGLKLLGLQAGTLVKRGSWRFPWVYARRWERIPHVAVACGSWGRVPQPLAGATAGNGDSLSPIFPPQLY